MKRFKYSLMTTIINIIIPKQYSNPHIWFTDSKISNHFSSHRDLFNIFHKLNEFIFIEIIEEMIIEIDMEIIILMTIDKDDIEMKLWFNNVIYTFNMNSNLFSFMMIYDRDFKIWIIFEYNLRIFHEETLVINIIKIQEGFFRLKIVSNIYTMMTI